MVLLVVFLAGCAGSGNDNQFTANPVVNNPGTVTIGGTAPTPPPTVSTVSPNSGPSSGGTVITIGGSNFLPGASVRIGGVPATSVMVTSNSTITAVTPPNVAGALEVLVTNPDGQQGALLASFSYVAGPAPSILTVSPNSGPSSGGTNVFINGRDFQSGTVVLFGGTPATNVMFSSPTQLQATTPARPAGTVDITVRNPDSQTGTLANAFDFQSVPAPGVTQLSPSSGPAAGGTTVTITGTNFQPGATIIFGGASATAVMVISPTQIQAVTPARAPGVVDVTVRNADNQTATLLQSFTFVPPPSVNMTAPGSGPAGGGTSVIITGSGFQAGASVTFGGTAASAVTVNNSTQITVVTPSRAAGTVTVAVQNPDGQTGSLLNGFTFVAASNVTSVSPSTGPTAGGTVTTITGSNFQAGATVLFGSTAATVVTVNSSTQITATTPAQNAGTVTVTVINPDGTSGLLANAFTFLAAPAVTVLSPNFGPTLGGTTVTITGSGFQMGATVRFGGTLGMAITFVNATQLMAVTPPGAAGAVDVQVTNADGQSGTLTGGFSYQQAPAPIVTGASPGSGSTAGGTLVNISGANFVSGAMVRFGATLSPMVTFVSATSLTAVTPAGAAGDVSVQVTNPDGQSGSLAAAFTFVPPPTITTVSPSSGPVAGGTAITINGTGFQSGATVRIGGTLASSVNFVSATQLTAVTPAGAAGPATVQVTNPDTQVGSLPNGFTYVAAPTVTSIAPTSGPTAGGTAVTITGTGFQAGATVMFDAASATSIVVVNATTITAVTPAHAAGTANVTVRNPDNQQGTLAAGFTYFAPPTVTNVAPSSGPTAGGTSITITGTAFRAGATVLVGGNAATAVVVVNATTITATTPAGAGTVAVRVTNTDGQFGSLASAFTYVPPPVVNSVSPNNGPAGGGTSITITGTGFQAGATVTVGGNPATAVVVVNATTITATTPAGAGTVTVQVTNTDGQSGSLANSFTYIPAPTVTSVLPSSGPVVGGTFITITGTGFQFGAMVTVGGNPGTSVNFMNATTLTAVTPAGAAGPATVQVTNPDGQFGSLAGGFIYNPPPTVANVNPNSGDGSGGLSVTVSGTGFQPGAIVEFNNSDSPLVTFVNSTMLTAVTPPHGAGTVNVTVTNPDGQQGTLVGGFIYTPVSPAAPTVTNVTPNSGPTSGGTVVTVDGTNFQNGAVVFFGGTAAASTTFVGSTQLTATTAAGAAATVSVTVRNPDTLTGTLTGAFTFIAPPTVTTVSPNSGPSSGGTAITVTGTAFRAGATVMVGGNPAGSIVVVSATQITAVTPAGTAGPATVQVTNPDGQSGSLAAAFTFVPPPTVTTVSPSSGPVAGGTAITITGTGFQSGATVRIGGTLATSVNFVSATQLTAVTPAGAAGPATVQVTNPDTQVGSLPNGFTYVAAPTVTSIAPTSGPTAGGTAVTITGTGFQAGATVMFDAASATSIVVVNATTITAVTPAHAAGTANVTVRNPDNQQGTLAAGFTYFAPPTVTNVAPSSGPTAGGTSITITGTAFRAGATVLVGGNAATAVAVVNATTITATTPAGAGTVAVRVTNTDGQFGSLASGFTYVPPPVVNSVSPNNGPAGGGTSITITGTGFQAGATVTVGGNPATAVVVVNATTITATTPAGAGTVTVQVTNTDGQSGSLANSFTYVAPPNATSAAPSSGPTAGGTLVTITGTGFVSGATVTFGGTAAASVTFVSSVQIRAVTPARAAGLVNIVVLNPDNQSSTLNNAFNFVPAPTISAVSPTSGPAAGGTVVMVTGTNYQAGATVLFGATTATSTTFVSATQLNATAPMHAAGLVDVQVRNPDNQVATRTNAYTFVAPPSISAVSPGSGPLSGGTIVTITGSGFQSGATVRFGGTLSGTVMFVSSTQLTAVAPAGAAGTVSVQVTNPDTQSGTLTSAFTYSPAPTISSVSPNGGSLAGGTDVTITGNNFAVGANVFFGGSLAGNIVVNSATNIDVNAPAHAAGTVSVTVQNPDGQNGTLANSYTYAPAPTISSVSPNSGTTTGGTTVTINGTGFQMSATVIFGTVASANVTFVSSTQLQADTPAGSPGTVNVVVVNPDGQTVSLTNGFTYSSSAPAPRVNSVSPLGGPQTGGTAVTILGENFQAGALVRFGTAMASNVVVLTPQQLTCVTPPNPNGPVTVSVTNLDLQVGSLANAFNYQLSTVTITTTDLPDGQVGIPFGAAFSATGGLAPYKWTVVVGSLPPGLSLNMTTGLISGQATQPGSFAFTVQAADSAAPAPQTAVGAFTIVITQITVVPGPAELPRVFIDTTMPVQTGATIRVSAGGNLQTAINNATCGDTIRLQSGAVFTGNFTLPNKPCNGWIIIRTDVPDTSLPPQGTRITPAFAPILAKIQTVNTAAAVRADVSAHNYRFLGVMFQVEDSVTSNGGVVRLDTTTSPTSLTQLPHDFVFDRVIVRGNATGQMRRGINTNAATVAVIDSYIFEIHETGADTQAIGSSCGPGPFKFVNNYLEASGENIIFGGAICNINDLVASDIEIRRNHFFKPLSWRAADPSFAGITWNVKNLFEIKNAQRVLLEGNIFENNWVQAQLGIAINLKASTQAGAMDWVTCNDITFRYNIIVHATGALTWLGVDPNDPNGRSRLTRFNLSDNLFDDITGNWGTVKGLFQVIAGADNLLLNHNTGFHQGTVMAPGPGTGPFSNGFIYRNNLSAHLGGFKGDGQSLGLNTLNRYFPGFIFEKNILAGGLSSSYPPNNFFPVDLNAVMFVDLPNGNYRLSAASPFKNAGTDGRDVGARIGATESATAGVR